MTARKHQKTIALLLVCCMALSLCACGLDLPGAPATPALQPAGTGTPDAQPDTSAQEPAAAGEDNTPAAEPLHLSITEVMTANKATLAVGNTFPDWVELRNDGDAEADLSRCSLSNGKDSAQLTGTLAPGAYTVICCKKGTAVSGCLPFSLSKEGCTLTLTDRDGTTLDGVTVPALSAGESWARTAEGFAVTAYPTPGESNDDAGYERTQELRSANGLVINEVMTSNHSCPDENGDYSDWVELKNCGTETVSLSGRTLYDGSGREYALPEGQSLAPGELTVIYCNEDTTGFSLSNTGECLYLTAADGSLTDYVYLRNIPAEGSYGRTENRGGFFYFTSPTPGAENTAGWRMLAASPVAAERDGIYDGADAVTVTLSAPGTIYYTTDGSLPTTASACYTTPLTLSKTTVIRAISVEEEKLTGACLTLSYIINEGHSLPVVSLVAEPDDMFGGKGVYSHPLEDIENPATFAYYDGETSVTIDCGVKLHGATSKVAQSKKSLKLNFRGRYAGELEYDLFGNGVTEFSSILLRAAQESSISSHLRDVTIHELAAQCTDALPTQATQFAALYINGEYWGLYAIREAHSANHYANHYGLDADTVTMTHEDWKADPNATALCDKILIGGLAEEENYAAVSAHIDVENLAAWCLMEGYTGNLDIYPPNVRWYYSTEDEVFRYALVDLDLGMFVFGNFWTPLATGNPYSDIPVRLLKNAGFRDEFLRCWGGWLSGPLSDENVTATLDRLATHIQPEIARDAERWGYTQESWEQELNNYLYALCNPPAGHAMYMAKSAAAYFGLSDEEFSLYFGNVAERNAG